MRTSMAPFKKCVYLDKQETGFTIVELLIVVVVIAILASLSIVSYNGIQARAENNKTLTAANSYFKAIKMYEIDNGRVPQTFASCLGENYIWDFAGNDSGTNQCRSTNSGTAYYFTRGSINTELKDYINPLPKPSMKAIGDETTWARGITYEATGSAGSGIDLIFGLKNIDSCPPLGDQSPRLTVTLSNGVRCHYTVGTRL